MRSNQRMLKPAMHSTAVQTIAVLSLEVASIHPVVHFQVADDGFDRLSSFESLHFVVRQALKFAAVLDVNI